MKQSVLSQAEGRLKLAERAFEAICQAGQNRVTFQVHWLDFLVQWKGTYTKIQQAAKESPQEIQWFGTVNRERRDDPLLRYLFEARNDGEHGTDQSAQHNGPGFSFTTHGKEIKIKSNPDGTMFFGPNGKPVVLDDEKEVEEISIHPAESRLLEVKEYDGKRTVPPPTTHLSSPMEPTPHVAADLGLKWLRSLVATAVAMSEP